MSGVFDSRQGISIPGGFRFISTKALDNEEEEGVLP
jgi:hypothetical protein